MVCCRGNMLGAGAVGGLGDIKEFIIVFIIALGVGSYFNSVNDASQAAAGGPGAETASNLPQVNDKDFKAEVLDSQLPVLVDFWAPWCGPCVREGPVVEQIALKYVGRLKVVKVNVDKASEFPAKYGVNGIPNLSLFKQGELVNRIEGAAPEEVLDGFINKNLTPASAGSGI